MLTLFLLLTSPFVLASREICGVAYDITHRLGQGSFGYVDHAIEIKTRRSVAIKFVKLKTEMDLVFFKREVYVMQQFIGKKEFVQFYNSCVDDTTLYAFIVMEYCNQGDLSLSQHQLSPFWTDFSNALKIMKQQNVVHRDLKLENLFLHNGRLKVGDFGLAEVLTKGQMLSALTGTRKYFAPEMLSDKPKYDFAVDLWAAGIVLFWLETGYHPYLEGVASPTDINRRLHLFLRNPNRFQDLPPRIIQVVDALLQEDPSNRRLLHLQKDSAI